MIHATLLFLRALISGGIATAVHFGVLISCLNTQLVTPMYATMLGWSCGFLVNYPLQMRWTFKAQGTHKRFFSRYVCVSAAMFVLNAVIFWSMTLAFMLSFFNALPFSEYFFTRPKNLAYLYAQVFTTAITFLINFAINHRYTFKALKPTPL